MTTPYELGKAFRLGTAFKLGMAFRLGMAFSVGARHGRSLALDDRWITVHPNGKYNAKGDKTKGQPIRLNDDGVVVGGAGGSLNGKALSPRKAPQNNTTKNTAQNSQTSSKTQKQPSAFATSLGSKDYALYRKAISGGDAVALSVFNKAESRLKIGSLSSRRNYFSSSSGEIFVNEAGSSAGGGGNFGESLSHETGHAIDWLLSPTRWFSFDNTGFKDTILDDARNYVNSKLLEMKKDFSSLPRDEYLRKYKSFEVQNSSLAPTKREAYAEVTTDLYSEPRDRDNYLTCGVISDIFGGATRNKAHGGIGHSASYWSQPENLAIEAFANLFSISLHCPKQMQRVERYFPNSVKHFKKILQDMEKKL